MSIVDASRQSIARALGGAVRNSHRLGFVCQKQEQTQWCWSAVAVSVSRFYAATSAWTQRRLASAERTGDSNNGEGCNEPWYLETALARVGHSDGGITVGAASFGEVVSEVDDGQPLGVRVEWAGGGGHFVVVEGYDDRGEMVEVEDPMNGHVFTSYADLVTAYGGSGTWTHSYRTKD